MKPRIVHEWPRRMSDAARIKRETIAPLIDLYGSVPDSGFVLGIEAVIHEPSRRVYCATTLMRYPGFTEIDRNVAEDDTPFGHAPELASFREGRAICRAVERIQTRPDLIMIHGDGINAPGGVGVANHIGVIFEIPTIGCFRRLRFGDRPKVGEAKGSVAKVVINGKEVAAALRSKEGTKPIYISPGYQISLDDSVEVVQTMLRGFRTPEPIRVPHLLATRFRNAQKKSGRDQQY